jgi:hypothetical protein
MQGFMPFKWADFWPIPGIVVGPDLKNYTQLIMVSSEYWMIYEGQGSLALVWFVSSTISSPPPHPSGNCLSFSVFLCVADWAHCWEGGEGGGGAKSYDGLFCLFYCLSCLLYSIPRSLYSLLSDFPAVWLLFLFDACNVWRATGIVDSHHPGEYYGGHGCAYARHCLEVGGPAKLKFSFLWNEILLNFQLRFGNSWIKIDNKSWNFILEKICSHFCWISGTSPSE